MKFLRSLVRRRFAGEPVVVLRNVGHFQANRQSVLKLSIHCFLEIFFTSQYIAVIASCFRRCYKTYSFKKSETEEKSNSLNCLPNDFCVVCVWEGEIENSIIVLQCHWANKAAFLKAF